MRRDKSSKKGSGPSHGGKEISTIITHSAPNASNIKCFKCLGKGELENETSSEEHSSTSEAEAYSGDSYHVGELLMVRCLVLGNLCSMIIDGGSSVNVGSLRLVKKLAFLISTHPRPYKLQWLSEKGELLVDRLRWSLP
ncbi:hypothetical protein CR513_23938, partial [Mucuna pruriens]